MCIWRITAAHFFTWDCDKLNIDMQVIFQALYESLQVVTINVTSKNDPTDMLMASMGLLYTPAIMIAYACTTAIDGDDKNGIHDMMMIMVSRVLKCATHKW